MLSAWYPRPVLSRTSSLEALFKLTRLDDGRCEYSLPVSCRSRQVVPDREFVSTVVGVPCAGERCITLPCAHASSAGLVCGRPPGTRVAVLRSLATCHPSSMLARSVLSRSAGVGPGGTRDDLSPTAYTQFTSGDARLDRTHRRAHSKVRSTVQHVQRTRERVVAMTVGGAPAAGNEERAADGCA